MPRYGKYRARVLSVSDPEERGRVLVSCPKVMGEGHSAWCEICTPFAYEGGGDFCLPKVDDTVWIEFEEGDPSRPIWVGGWWSVGNTSNKNYANASKLRTIEFDGCLIEMQKDQIKISVGDNSLVMNREGIFIQNTSNSISMSNSGTTIKTQGNAVLRNSSSKFVADLMGDVTIQGSGSTKIKGGGATIQMSGDIKLRGYRIDLN